MKNSCFSRWFVSFNFMPRCGHRKKSAPRFASSISPNPCNCLLGQLLLLPPPDHEDSGVLNRKFPKTTQPSTDSKGSECFSGHITSRHLEYGLYLEAFFRAWGARYNGVAAVKKQVSCGHKNKSRIWRASGVGATFQGSSFSGPICTSIAPSPRGVGWPAELPLPPSSQFTEHQVNSVSNSSTSEPDYKLEHVYPGDSHGS